MVIPEGYKKTEIGVVPEDWEVQPFSNLFSIGHGKDQKEIEEKDGKFPILATSGVIGYTNKFLYNRPSALIGRKGTINKPQYTETPFWTIDTLFYTKVFDNAFPKYIYYMFCVIDWLSLNEASGVPSLSAYNIEKIRCAIPSLSEQRIIANALSDVDSMISSLEKLIEKKKAIKQGAMQELLTGQKRLPGFGGMINKVRLSDIAFIKDGTHSTYERISDGVLLLSAKNIFNNHLEITENESMVSDDDYMAIVSNGFPKNGDILLSCVGTIGRCCIYSGIPKAAFQRSVAFVRSKGVDTGYLLYLLQLENTQKQLRESANASAQGGVYLGALENLKVEITNDLNEQSAIASILSDMDNEIDALEQKLKKARQLKQGMMQQLLTGKIRLL